MKTASLRPRVVLITGATLLLLLALWWLWRRWAAEQIPPGNPRFGLAFISPPDDLANDARYRGALMAGARWDRWPLYWHWVDQGGYDGPHRGGSHNYDALVTQELELGLTPVVILMGTPARQAKINAVIEAAPNGPLPPKPGSLPAVASTATLPPQSLFEPIFADGSDIPGPGKTINPANAWAAFVFATVERYRPGGALARQQGWPKEQGVRYWEIWNEPDYDLFWRGTVEEYHRLLETAYQSVKAADPEATVILGGLAFYDKPRWLADLLRQTGGDPERAYFEVFSFHHYFDIYRSEQLLAQTRAALDSYGLEHVPVWITESGVSVWDDYPATAHRVAPDTPLRATANEQAAYVIQNSALAFYNGVARYYHFSLHDDCGDGPDSAYGLRQNFSPHVCNPANGQPRPAYAGYQLAAAHFRELIPLWREKGDRQDWVAFFRPDDRTRLLAGWARQGITATARLTATGPSAQLHWVEPTGAVSGTTALIHTQILTPANGFYTLKLPPATNRNHIHPNDPSYPIGGRPYVLVEPDTQPPHTTVDPLPEESPPGIWLRWQANDPGSGIAAYEVWAGEDGQPPQLWLADTPQTEAIYTGRVNHRYSFVIRARDRAGNLEPLPGQPQVSTQVIAAPAVTGVVLGPKGQPVANAVVTISGPSTRHNLSTNPAGQWQPVPLLPGIYTFQADAPGYGLWPAPRHINLTGNPLTVTLTLAPATEAVSGGDFEGADVWNGWDWTGQVDLFNDAFDGRFSVRLGRGRGESTTCQNGQSGQQWRLRQQVNIPEAGEPELSFVYKTSPGQHVAGEAGLSVLLVANGQSSALLSPAALPPTPDWVFAWADLSAWRGKTATLQIQVIRCSERPFTVNLDRVSIG